MSRSNIAVTVFLAAISAQASFSADSVHASQSYDNCTGFIDALPATINSLGNWCLRQNLSTSAGSGNSITISTSNVTLDCNEFSLDGTAAGASTNAYGINAYGVQNTLIRHCTVRGFYNGVYASSPSGKISGIKIEDSRFDMNTSAGISVVADGAIVTRNQITNTGGSNLTFVASGIITNGSVDIIDNSISGVSTSVPGYVYGINAPNNSSGRIIGNGIRGLGKFNSSSTAYGINLSNNGRNAIRNNDVVAENSAGNYGLFCTNSAGRALNNTISGFYSGLMNCANVGNNDSLP